MEEIVLSLVDVLEFLFLAFDFSLLLLKLFDLILSVLKLTGKILGERIGASNLSAGIHFHLSGAYVEVLLSGSGGGHGKRGE